MRCQYYTLISSSQRRLVLLNSIYGWTSTMLYPAMPDYPILATFHHQASLLTLFGSIKVCSTFDYTAICGRWYSRCLLSLCYHLHGWISFAHGMFLFDHVSVTSCRIYVYIQKFAIKLTKIYCWITWVKTLKYPHYFDLSGFLSSVVRERLGPEVLD